MMSFTFTHTLAGGDEMANQDEGAEWTENVSEVGGKVALFGSGLCSDVLEEQKSSAASL